MKNKLQKNHELHSTTITTLSHDGRGIATMADGKTTFISGALPGEEVAFRLIKKHTRYNEGEVQEILAISPNRVIPACKHFGVCGGCSMQHIAMHSQIEIKQTVLLEQLKHFGKVEAEEVLPPITGSELGYRRKARLGVNYVTKKGRVLIGFREKGTGILADVETCAVLDISVGLKLPDIAALITSLSQFQNIPQIEIAVSDTITTLVFRHLTDLSAEDLEKMCEFGLKHNIHIYLQPNSPAQIHRIWPEAIAEKLAYELAAYQLEMQFHPMDFTQVNGEINLLMVERALAMLAPTAEDNVLDLFCGLGNFTLPIARFAKHVTGIEGSIDMVKRGEENALHNDIHNTNFYAANLAVIPSMRPTWMKQQYDKILLDPPRTGAKEIIALFPKFAAQRVVYVSCNPATLARDAGELVHKHGYKLKKIGVINMFPHTSHIEAIALFEKN
jgi:23S rRNA (uracil1939-C5)-methyltransferase